MLPCSTRSLSLPSRAEGLDSGQNDPADRPRTNVPSSNSSGSLPVADGLDIDSAATWLVALRQCSSAMGAFDDGVGRGEQGAAPDAAEPAVVGRLAASREKPTFIAALSSRILMRLNIRPSCCVTTGR